MNSNTLVSLLNIACIGVSVVIADIVPFELLLFSYAVFGPAHCLTEISWLHDRNYFTTGRWDFIILTVLCVLSLILVNPTARTISFLLAFVGAGVMAYTERRNLKRLWLIALTATLFAIQQNLGFGHSFSTLVATVVHVYLFTGAFILLGALRRKSRLDFLTLVCFVGAALVFFVFPPNAHEYSTTDSVTRSIFVFDVPNAVFRQLFGMEMSKESFVTVMAFFAFAYTYHYLNWFTKTNIIRWHQVPRARLLLMITIYVGSLALYRADYVVGFHFLLFLSLLHVFLEFPLNYRTFVDIGRTIVPGRRVPTA